MPPTTRPVELRVLGAIDLASVDARSVELVLHQTKRLALFSYLVLARPRGFHRRDELLGLFWPHFDAAHAHSALRQAVHHIRRGIGAETIQRRGSQDLGVDEGAVWCDATEFERALRERRYADALELYRGDLLPGLFVTQAAAEFDHWLDAERMRFRRLAAQTAWTYSAQLDRHGNVAGSIEWARRASELAAFDEIALRRLMTVLERHGDHAGAMQAYDEFRCYVAAARGYAVSPETTRLVGELTRFVEAPARR